MGLLKFSRQRQKIWFWGVLFSIFSASALTYAAPYPATGSSLLVAPEMGLFWKRHGFQLKTGATGWILGTPVEGEEPEVHYDKPGKPTASLTVRSEMLKTDLSLENYTKRWMKDYSNYGFDLLGTQTFFQNGSKALVVDLIHRKTEQQLRQVLFLKNKKVVILTCKDLQKSFEQTLNDCNQISKSFEWAEINRQTTF